MTGKRYLHLSYDIFTAFRPFSIAAGIAIWNWTGLWVNFLIRSRDRLSVRPTEPCTIPLLDPAKVAPVTAPD